MALTLQQRIIFTLAYSFQFSHPLSISELYTRLVGVPKVSYEEFLFEIETLVETNILKYKDGLFFFSYLSKREVEKYLQLRKKRLNYSQKKWAESNIFINLVKRIPFILGVAVTGSVAMNNAVQDDDIDFLIVTKQNRLWITRLLLVAIASFLGKRRSFAQEEKNSWCFNLWVEQSDLQLPKNSRSIYEAYEVVQTKWVYSKNSIAELFFVSNRWAFGLLSHSNDSYMYFKQRKNTQLWSSISFSEILFTIAGVFLDLCNYLCFLVQYVYMKRHMTREKVSLSHAFFHPRDTRSQVYSKINAILKRVNKIS